MLGDETPHWKHRISRSTPLREIPFVVLDIETTGLDTKRDRVVEIGAVRLDGGTLRREETFHTRVDPGGPIPPAASAIHGIHDADVAGAPSFEGVNAELERFVSNAVIVGQSIGFDLAVLLQETRRIGVDWDPAQFLDTKLLHASLIGKPVELGLDELAEAYGVDITGRHSALGDALATAEIFVRMVPALEEAGVSTLGEARAHQSAQTWLLERQARQGWYDATYVRPAEAWQSGRDRDAAAALDPFAYRHTLNHIMNRNPVFLASSTTASEAAKAMTAVNTSAALVGDESERRAWGIITERDLVRTLGEHGSGAAEVKIESIMSSPIVALEPDAFVYRALGRMQRLRIRRVAVNDAAGRTIGLVSMRRLLAERSGPEIVLGDEITTAASPVELARARRHLPRLGSDLLHEGIDAENIGRVLSMELRDLNGRAAVLAEHRMEAEGAGRPPVPYALALLGSGARGESLLAPRQDNALVYESGDADGVIDGWFSRFGAHFSEILHASGIATGSDGATVGTEGWRGTPEGWLERIEVWAQAPSLAAGDHAELVFDAQLAYGDAGLGQDLRAAALRQATGHAVLASVLARGVLDPRPLASDLEAGTFDLETDGLTPLACAARVMAVYNGVDARSTTERLASVCSLGRLSAEMRDDLDAAHSLLMRLVLQNQVRRIAAGLEPSSVVPRSELDVATVGLVQDALRITREKLPGAVRAAIVET